MNRVQYVSQKAVKVDDVRDLSDREQDEFIREVALSMERDMRARVADARPMGNLAFWVTGPHADPIQGLVHVHNVSAWFDLDAMPADAPFRLEAIKAASSDAAPIT